MGFSNRKEKLIHDIQRAEKEILNFEQDKKDLDLKQKNTYAVLQQWKLELQEIIKNNIGHGHPQDYNPSCNECENKKNDTD